MGDFFALFIVTKQLGGIATYRVCLSKHDFCLLKCENLDNNCTVIGEHRMDLHTILKIRGNDFFNKSSNVFVERV